MKLLFLLVFLPLCLAFCPVDHFKDEILKKCVKCTPCHVTLIPCKKNKDAICEYFSDNLRNHHFAKKKIHFFDDTVDDQENNDDEQFHLKNFVPHSKDHKRKSLKHANPKHEDKHHHKKKHFEFEYDDKDDKYDDEYYNDDGFDFNFEKIEKPKPHTKHFEFKNKDDLSPEYEDEKLHFILGKDSKKKKNKSTHVKKTDFSEEELERLLIQSEMKLELRKDNLLKTLKDENGGGKLHSKNKIRLNSPVSYSDSDENYDNSYGNSKSSKTTLSDSLEALSDLEGSVDEDDEIKITQENFKSVLLPKAKNHKKPVDVIGQGKDVDDMIRSEMGGNLIHEKPRFNVIPLVVGKDFNLEKKGYSHKHHLSATPINALEADFTDIKTNEVVSLPFTAAETLVWDWQAVAVASAVASCLVFFLVLALYFLCNARQWKKENQHYNRELEDMSTRVSLMHPIIEPDHNITTLYMENIRGQGKEETRKGEIKV